MFISIKSSHAVNRILSNTYVQLKISRLILFLSKVFRRNYIFQKAKMSKFMQIPPEHLEMNEYVKRLITCPHCRTCISPPYRQCKFGHLLCSNPHCRISESTCFCRERILDFEIKSLNEIYRAIYFPCQFAIKGCDVFVTGGRKQLDAHHAYCNFNPNRRRVEVSKERR